MAKRNAYWVIENPANERERLTRDTIESPMTWTDDHALAYTYDSEDRAARVARAYGGRVRLINGDDTL